jgi:uncharacterized protein
MMIDHASAWLGFLASPAAPKGAMSVLELDGYLSGVVVAPSLIPPSRWIVPLWGDDEPVFEDDDQVTTVLGAVMVRYNALIAEIDASLGRLEATRICDYRPMFQPADTKPKHAAIRQWANGFWKAMALDPKGWSAFAEDERTQILITPFVGFVQLDDPDKFEPAENIDELLDEAAAAIPRALLILRKIAKMRAGRKPSRRIETAQLKIGRNDPCPCGSGKKFKRCCAAA